MPTVRPKKPKEVFHEHVIVTVHPAVKKGGDRFCPVTPGVAHVRYGGTVTFRCEKGCGPLEVFVPTPNREPELFPHSGRVLAVPATRAGRTFKVVARKHDAPHPVEYPYAVYCRDCRCFGRGSMPRMIIGP